MVDVTGAEITSAEVEEYESVINAIECEHRRDLGVHLYLTVLLHRVNPLFPPKEWASWPLQKEEAVDPRTITDGEDLVFKDDTFGPHKKGLPRHIKRQSARRPPALFMATAEPSGSQLPIVLRQHNKSNAKTTLLNEIHCIVERKIRKLARHKRLVAGEVPLELDSMLMQSLVTRLANRMGHVLHRCSNNKLRQPEKPHDTPAVNLKTWQDVMLAHLSHDLYSRHVEVKTHRRLYQKMRRLFKEVSYPYEFDADAFVDAESGTSAPVPPFTVKTNIALLSPEELGLLNAGPLRILMTQRSKEEAFKERLFMGLLGQAARERKLSYAAPGEEAEESYIPPGDVFHQERKRVFERTTLSAKDFLFDTEGDNSQEKESGLYNSGPQQLEEIVDSDLTSSSEESDFSDFQTLDIEYLPI